MHCFHCTVHTRSTSGLHILQNIKQWLCQQWIQHTSNSQAPNHLNYYWGSNKRYDSMHHPRTSKMMKINNFSIFLSCSWWESHRLWPVWGSVSEGRCSRGPPTDPHRCDTNTNPHCTQQTHSNVLHSVYAASYCMYKFGFEGPHVFTFNKIHYYCTWCLLFFLENMPTLYFSVN